MGTNTQRHIRPITGLVTLCLLAASCGGGSDEADADVTVPATDGVEVPVTEVATTVAPTTTAAPVEEAEIDVPSLPCAEYVAEVGYPLKPCDSGVLVETLQRDLESLFPDIGIDGLFGQQTFGFIEEYQTANGLEATGVVSEELANAIAASDGLGSSAASTTTDATGDSDSTTDADADAEASGDDSSEAAGLSESENASLLDVDTCTSLIGNPDDPAFTAAAIETCSDLGVDLVYGEN